MFIKNKVIEHLHFKCSYLDSTSESHYPVWYTSISEIKCLFLFVDPSLYYTPVNSTPVCNSFSPSLHILMPVTPMYL